MIWVYGGLYQLGLCGDDGPEWPAEVRWRGLSAVSQQLRWGFRATLKYCLSSSE